jgi:hypothetical protein
VARERAERDETVRRKIEMSEKVEARQRAERDETVRSKREETRLNSEMVSRYREFIMSGKVWHRYWQIGWRCAPQFQCVARGRRNRVKVGRFGSVRVYSFRKRDRDPTPKCPDFNCHQRTVHVNSSCIAVRLLSVSNMSELRHTLSMKLY